MSLSPRDLGRDGPRKAFAAIALALPVAALAVCPAPEVAIPAQDSVADKQPSLVWKPVEGATGYRVRVLSRVPNGRIVASHDAVVASPRFVPPQPLAEDHAKVTARISAICGAETSAESVFAFTIDATSTCRLDELSAETAGTKTNLKWPAVKGAASYEVRMFSLDGAFISAQETRAPAAQLESKLPAAVVSVRPACASGLGEGVYRVVAAPRPPG
jgi:hypothetical protein